jgi:glycosyltransferase involved in cell wall biosynthesis
MGAPCVSVIITSYNRAELLREAIQSVIEQSFGDYEIVIVDDGSKDHSLEVIESFRKADPDRIWLFMHDNQSNRGVQETHLLGIAKARGEFVAFLDNDDRWTPNYLASKVDLLRSHPEVAVVFSPYRVVGEGWFGRDMVLRQWLLKSTVKRSRPFDNFGTLLRFNNVATFSCFVTRKSLLEASLSPSEDTLLFDWGVLHQLSMHGLYLLDRSSMTFWRLSKQSTMGRQPYQEIKDQVCRFMEHMYHQVDEDIDHLSEGHREVFRRLQAIFPYFLSYYRKPKLLKFIRFFGRSPTWAMSSMLSLVINYFKFR